MEIFQYLEEMQNELFEGDLEKIEEKYSSLCLKLAGKEQVEKIRSVNLEAFEQGLKEGLIQSIDIANQNSAKAIYYEYDLDNEWNSGFFICEEYNSLEEEDDDWACDWNEVIDGPDLKSYGDIYLENGFDSTDKAIGSTLYLVARTVCVFAKVVSEIANTVKIPICIAFHDQDPIMRISKDN
ncbi:hypothetical protein [Defluviitalea phaphyphila]|uniref:hypothetical protein n=1 Tax=Defluviitalea phaphyphila TaxID=1473580 RepID=UPI00072FEF2B|nr:hypothetical protein [Defluviitalea phaphyphila]